ncbi:MAG: SLBB domain-containing protein [Saprospiraceae bacterium]|nr:SLBB domain-containing protein [Saprospiraceae bacterium]
MRSSSDRLVILPMPGSAVILGAVNRPGSFQVNVDGNLSLKDAIYISGGLKENATNFGYLFKNNPKTPTVREYQYIDLENAEILNQKINSGDSIVIYSKEAYTDLSKVSIAGAVRSPSDYVYNPSLTLKDLIILAGGLRIDAAPNRVDVFRLDYDQNKTTKTIAKSLDLKNSNIFDSEMDFPLQPFDIVVVRQAPEFRLQTSVTIEGEVVYPGIYAAIQENTRLSSVIKQAGGLTNQAYNAGAKLFRSGVGFIVVDLQAAMNQIGGPQDFILEDGDLITVPKRNSLVSIEGAVHIDEVASDIARDQGKLYVSFLGKKSAKYYVQEYAGGFKDNAKTDDLIVEYQNGKIKKTSKFYSLRNIQKFWKAPKFTCHIRLKNLSKKAQKMKM